MAGGSIQLPNGITLSGNNNDGYIYISQGKKDCGAWSRSLQGLRSALDDAEKIYAESRRNDFSDIIDRSKRSRYIGGIGIFTAAECQNNQVDYPKNRRSAMSFNIVNEDGLWLDGAGTRYEIRRKFIARLENA